MKRLLLFLLLLLVAAPAPAQQEGFVTTDDGVRLFYRIEGRGPQTLGVVLGGPGVSLGSSRRRFAPLVPPRRVMCYDERGSAASSLIDEPAKLAVPLPTADLDAIRRHFRLGRMNLIGN